ncbi:hypothetical protein DFH09DRAFT_1331664 [Mycena vulgaris]|nr:hypothetical protein DFH09DRAFT_1331664 [Mycena vulgaris]
MLWVPRERKTRSGTIFLPFWPLHATTLSSEDFDFAPLLRQSVVIEEMATMTQCEKHSDRWKAWDEGVPVFSMEEWDGNAATQAAFSGVASFAITPARQVQYESFTHAILANPPIEDHPTTPLMTSPPRRGRVSQSPSSLARPSISAPMRGPTSTAISSTYLSAGAPSQLWVISIPQAAAILYSDLKMVIEFPHAATILLPSATIAHSNIPVGAHEARGSFTQYTPGGLIRYVDNGFRTEGELEEEDPEEYARLAALKETHWAMGIGMLSTVDNLLQPVQ